MADEKKKKSVGDKGRYAPSIYGEDPSTRSGFSFEGFEYPGKSAAQWLRGKADRMLNNQWAFDAFDDIPEVLFGTGRTSRELYESDLPAMRGYDEALRRSKGSRPLKSPLDPDPDYIPTLPVETPETISPDPHPYGNIPPSFTSAHERLISELLLQQPQAPEPTQEEVLSHLAQLGIDVPNVAAQTAPDWSGEFDPRIAEAQEAMKRADQVSRFESGRLGRAVSTKGKAVAEAAKLTPEEQAQQESKRNFLKAQQNQPAWTPTKSQEWARVIGLAILGGLGNHPMFKAVQDMFDATQSRKQREKENRIGTLKEELGMMREDHDRAIMGRRTAAETEHRSAISEKSAYDARVAQEKAAAKASIERWISEQIAAQMAEDRFGAQEADRAAGRSMDVGRLKIAAHQALTDAKRAEDAGRRTQFEIDPRRSDEELRIKALAALGPFMSGASRLMPEPNPFAGLGLGEGGGIGAEGARLVRPEPGASFDPKMVEEFLTLLDKIYPAGRGPDKIDTYKGSNK